MPIKFPDTWGTKKQWPPIYETTPKIQTKEKNENTVLEESTGKMKCPRCGSWIYNFEYREPSMDFGYVDCYGDFESSDTDYSGDIVIVCPECKEEVFDSNINKLKKYYGTERRR